jgi:hypothetical protein
MGAPVNRIESRRQSADCATWALGTYLGIPYETVHLKVLELDRSKGKRGLHIATIRRVAAALLRPLVKRPASRVTDESYGILSVYDKTEGHVVVLRNGLVFDTDATVHDLDAWLAVRQFTVDVLLCEKVDL